MNKYLMFFVLLSYHCFSQQHQEEIIKTYLNDCAMKYNYNYQMKQWQDCLDLGLQRDSTIAYLWQQKAMPYFKAQKYEVGMSYLDKAVIYNPKRWLPYRGFIKCIFSKSYKEAIDDFEKSILLLGNQYEMDHTYRFYIALSYLQLNEFEKAETLFEQDISEQEQKFKTAHYLDLFYFGICKFELEKFDEAIVLFDKALEQYPQFSDVWYYKAVCLLRLGQPEKAVGPYEKAKDYAKQGYTINEDNVIYEKYPYQVRW
ncbi:tetratricopeptide repeat protein [Capnocytophaga stomatis]|uniref:tetratricopeptide repeat protein n=1 Tax=Capnocytophaga stomatis TaxID=1848904 RepID=UPI001AD16317|nr:tetratricopeptide repeat protein [Capnocytophaga stomatis]GIM49919.1 hypothetical protein CAPN003_13710 [Capnocytophaga stomatis]